MYDGNSVLVMNHKFSGMLVGTIASIIADLYPFNTPEYEGAAEPFSTVSAAALCLIRTHYR